MQIVKKNNFDEEDVSAILGGLREYNAGHAERKYTPFVITAKENGAIVAGAQCASKWDWMQVILLWVKEEFSHKGLGTKLMREIEDEARGRGCLGIFLDTFEFQALEFYQKLGYKIFGQIEDHPKGFYRYYMKKKLN